MEWAQPVMVGWAAVFVDGDVADVGELWWVVDRR